MNIKIIYEDEDVLVLDKPSKITVNKSDTTKEEYTIQDFLQEKFPIGDVSDISSDFYKRNGIVHRIDKETSGILLVAKNEDSFKNLQEQFKDRVVEKTYVALVHGNIKQGEGEIIASVGRLPWNRKRFGVLAGGKTASTKYKVIQEFKTPFTLIEAYPKTGRTHQIRVHMKYINHPLFSDNLYAGRKIARSDRAILDRIFLHAAKISFFHPKLNKKLSFESTLPIELENTLELLKG